jgi:GH18 family chitinase
MKYLKHILIILISMSFYGTALANQQVFAYYAGWSESEVPDVSFNGVLPAFALIHKDTQGNYYTDYSQSGNFQTWGTPAYHATNDWAIKYADYKNDLGKLYVSYGGDRNLDLRDFIIHANQDDIEKIASEIHANMKKYYFTGVDLDIEGWWSNYQDGDNVKFANNLAQLVILLRQYIDADQQTVGAKIIVTVGLLSAGPINGIGQDPRQLMTEFYNNAEAMNAVSLINIMSYSSGKEGFYSNQTLMLAIINTFKVALHNDINQYKKLIFGVLRVESARVNVPPTLIQQLAHDVIAPSGIGGMFLWVIGDPVAGANAKDYILAMQRGLGIIQ